MISGDGVAICKVAGFEEAGYEVAGFEVAGFEVAGLEVAGFEVAGFEVAGFEVAGFEVPGFEVAAMGGIDTSAQGFVLSTSSTSMSERLMEVSGGLPTADTRLTGLVSPVDIWAALFVMC